MKTLSLIAGMILMLIAAPIICLAEWLIEE